MANLTRKVYAILDEVFLAGEIQETSKQVVLTRLEHLDKLESGCKHCTMTHVFRCSIHHRMQGPSTC